MFCPKCAGEYRAGFTECADCQVMLVNQPVDVAEAPAQPMLELVTVFKSGNPAIVPLAKSLLESADISFVTKGESVQDVIGWGRFPAGVNFAVGPVEFQVATEDAEEARRLLEDLHESSRLDSNPRDYGDDDGQ